MVLGCWVVVVRLICLGVFVSGAVLHVLQGTVLVICWLSLRLTGLVSLGLFCFHNHLWYANALCLSSPYLLIASSCSLEFVVPFGFVRSVLNPYFNAITMMHRINCLLANLVIFLLATLSLSIYSWKVGSGLNNYRVRLGALVNAPPIVTFAGSLLLAMFFNDSFNFG